MEGRGELQLTADVFSRFEKDGWLDGWMVFISKVSVVEREKCARLAACVRSFMVYDPIGIECAQPNL
jgi:hypothetical protein